MFHNQPATRRYAHLGDQAPLVILLGPLVIARSPVTGFSITSPFSVQLIVMRCYFAASQFLPTPLLPSSRGSRSKAPIISV